MAVFFALFLICSVAACAIACAIDFFLQCGPWRALGYGMFAVAVFMIFAASGMWADASRHSWGALAPVFAIMLVGGWLLLRHGGRIWRWRFRNKGRKDD